MSPAMNDKESIIRGCPNCDAQYKVVRVEVSPTDTFREITCLSCGGPLQGRDGKSALKYFLAGDRGRRARRT
jgi:hypothetical protein